MLLTSDGQGLTPFQLAAHLRQDEELVGATNGVNITFILPNGDKAINQTIGAKILVKYNGQALHEGASNDFTVTESGGAGTGFDTVLLEFSPLPGDLIAADYIRRL